MERITCHPQCLQPCCQSPVHSRGRCMGLKTGAFAAQCSCCGLRRALQACLRRNILLAKQHAACIADTTTAPKLHSAQQPHVRNILPIAGAKPGCAVERVHTKTQLHCAHPGQFSKLAAEQCSALLTNKARWAPSRFACAEAMPEITMHHCAPTPYLSSPPPKCSLLLTWFPDCCIRLLLGVGARAMG